MEDYDYDLPEERIARYPLKGRSQSRLLIFKENRLSEKLFRNLPELLPSGSFLVFNNTRVIPARLLFRKKTGSVIEIFCLEPFEPSDYQMAFQAKGLSTWKCLVGNVKRWKSEFLEREAEVNGQKIFFRAELASRVDNTFLVRFSWDNRCNFGEIIENIGMLPIPPYLKREAEKEDEITYQTIYANIKGSVAAPTAGLHFTADVFNDLIKREYGTGILTLHVGAGTFHPVKSESIVGHPMHPERVTVSRKLIENLIKNEGKIIAVGTTSLRSLESLYWLGIKLFSRPSDQHPVEIGQWEPYHSNQDVSTSISLKWILSYLFEKGMDDIQFSTRLIVVPGYRFRVVNGLITNFHQPKSTLLLLVAAFLGPDWKRVYQYALENGFRFLSYGDSNLYLPGSV